MKTSWEISIKRFHSKYKVISSGCWEWTGAKAPNGYGMFWFNKRYDIAHRFSYKLFKGPIPDGLEMDHLCRNRGCINPDHLEAVTKSENQKRSAPYRHLKACRKGGHALTDRNIVINSKGGRSCRICANGGNRRRWRERRDGT